MSQPEPHIDIEGLELLRRDAAALPQELLERRRSLDSHLDTCAECSSLMKAYTVIIEGSSSKAGGHKCPEEGGSWLELASGLLSDPDLHRLLSHAAQCGTCSELLKEALQAVTDNTPDPEVAQLSSATPEWQGNLAARLVVENPGRSRTTTTFRFSRLIPSKRLLRAAYALAAIVLLAVTVSVWYHFHPSIEDQLASAYNARRLTELRIPRAAAVGMYSPARGDASSHDWPELLSVKLAAEEGLTKKPDSPYWRQIMGKTLVLQADPAGALAQFQAAYAQDPSLPGIQFDLGTAYFGLGDSTHDAANFGFAAEAFTRHLASLGHPDPVTLFNRALCWSRMGLKDQALKDLQQALASEDRADWQEAIRREMDALNQGSEAAAESADPVSDGLPIASSKRSPWIDDQYEDLVERLVVSSPVPALDGKLANDFAAAGRRHGDRWIVDWLAAHRTSSLANADAFLADAIRANRRGEADRAVDLARRAYFLYLGSGNDAGRVRAAFEQAYALHRSGRAKDCLSVIRNVSSLASTRYSYLDTMLQLEEASCLEMQGDPQPSRIVILRARSDAVQFAFPGLYARAQGFLAAYATQQGMPEQGWNDDVIGLKICRSLGCAPMRRYQFVSDLIDDAAALNLNQVAVLLAEANVRIAKSAENLQIEAYAFEILGQRQLECGLPTMASNSFSQADALLIKLGDVPASRAYRTDWSADRARLLVAQGYGDRALALINSVMQDAATAQSTVLQLDYWSARALFDRTGNRNSDELASAHVATGLADKVLGNLENNSDRVAWKSEARSAYAAWVDGLLKSGQSQQALDAWEFFSSEGESRLVSPPAVESVERILVAPAAPSKVRILVYARLIDAYVVFVVAEDGTVSQVIKLPAAADAIDQLARTFSNLCGNPNSRLSDIRMAGKSLYENLFPQPAMLSPHLLIQADGRLRNMPFAALMRSDGSYLGAHASIVLLSELRPKRTRPNDTAFTAANRLVILRGAASEQSTEAIPAVYDESSELAGRFLRSEVVDGRSSNEADIARLLRLAEIFHFTGHSRNQNGASRLLVGGTSLGDITPQTLEHMRLHSCRLVVLAACNTFSVEIQPGSMKSGLPEALLHAGVPTVIGTLWDVDSRATKQLMLDFYDQLLKGNPPEVALEIAEAQLGTHAEFAHPYYWSGFTVMAS